MRTPELRRSFLTRNTSFRNNFKYSVEEGFESEKNSKPSSGSGSVLSRQKSSPNEPSLGPLTVYRHRAMACDFEISLNEDDVVREEILDVFDLIDREEKTLSVFRSTSLLSRINMLSSEMDVSVPKKLFEQLRFCRSLWEETEGAFDITSAPLWKLWGFAKGEGRVPTETEIEETLKTVGMEHVILNEESQTVAFDFPGVEINFGAIGKGFALDDAAFLLSKTSLKNYLIHGGMSSALAFGGRTGDYLHGNDGSLSPCWSIGIADPIEPEHRLITLRLTNEAIGTSGSGRQYFFHQGKRFSHIIDPKTGHPAIGLLSVSVITPDAARADALSTAFFVMGVEKTEKYAQEHPETRVLLVMETKTGKREIVSLNMDDSDYRTE